MIANSWVYRIATAISPHRFVLVAVATLSFIALCVGIFVFPSPESAVFYCAAMGPLVLIPWGLVCCASWFGPSGKMLSRPNEAGIIRRVLRAYAMFVLLMFLLLGVAWPVFAVFELRSAR